MARDRTLGEFASTDDEEDDPTSPGAETQESDGSTPGTEADTSTPAGDAVEPIQSTYAYDGDGATCAACGGRADALWREGEDLVCAECKEW